jgi:transcriptional regulator with XRE-family HTH domain
MPVKSIPTNGAAIRVIRELLGVSREQAANAAGITTGAFANIENGRDASLRVLRAVADRLNVPVDALVRGRLVIEVPRDSGEPEAGPVDTPAAA